MVALKKLSTGADGRFDFLRYNNRIVILPGARFFVFMMINGEPFTYKKIKENFL